MRNSKIKRANVTWNQLLKPIFCAFLQNGGQFSTTPLLSGALLQRTLRRQFPSRLCRRGSNRCWVRLSALLCRMLRRGRGSSRRRDARVRGFQFALLSFNALWFPGSHFASQAFGNFVCFLHEIEYLGLYLAISFPVLWELFLHSF